MFGICEICNKPYESGAIYYEEGEKHQICLECYLKKTDLNAVKNLTDSCEIYRSDFEDVAQSVMEDIIDLLKSKRHDYGDSFERIWDILGPRSVLPRLFDKIFRLVSLLGKEEPKNESIEDTFRDIIGYCILAILKLRGDI